MPSFKKTLNHTFPNVENTFFTNLPVCFISIRLASIQPQKYVVLTLLVPIPDEQRKFNFNFIFTNLCGVSKGFMKALKAFIKSFEASKFIWKFNQSVGWTEDTLKNSATWDVMKFIFLYKSRYLTYLNNIWAMFS